MPSLRDVERVDDLLKGSYFDPETNRMHDITVQDVEPYLLANKRERESGVKPTLKDVQRGKLAKVASVPVVGYQRMLDGTCCLPDWITHIPKWLRGKRYNPGSNDPDERMQALLHIQNCHKEWLTVEKNPFGKIVSWR